MPSLRSDRIAGAMWSPHDLRIESRSAIPRLAAWLEAVHDVTFIRSTLARSVEPSSIVTSSGIVHAECAVVCPGHDFLTLFPERIAAYGLTTCKLHMMRIAPSSPAPRLGGAIMSDLGLVRYLGYAELPEAAALRRRLAEEQSAHLEHGVHLIAVQSADGSLYRRRKYPTPSQSCRPE